MIESDNTANTIFFMSKPPRKGFFDAMNRGQRSRLLRLAALLVGGSRDQEEPRKTGG